MTTATIIRRIAASDIVWAMTIILPVLVSIPIVLVILSIAFSAMKGLQS